MVIDGMHPLCLHHMHFATTSRSRATVGWSQAELAARSGVPQPVISAYERGSRRGALALAYCTAEPRATMDLDVNVFVPPTEVDVVASGLEAVVALDEAARTAVLREGQVRIWWGRTPLDLFFDMHDYGRRPTSAPCPSAT
jgi:transcriptional regulator with XRE-family HTH domain